MRRCKGRSDHLQRPAPMPVVGVNRRTHHSVTQWAGSREVGRVATTPARCGRGTASCVTTSGQGPEPKQRLARTVFDARPAKRAALRSARRSMRSPRQMRW